jgi:hypothetical protein
VKLQKAGVSEIRDRDDRVPTPTVCSSSSRVAWGDPELLLARPHGFADCPVETDTFQQPLPAYEMVNVAELGIGGHRLLARMLADPKVSPRVSHSG